jgi:hypothetical protein
MSSPFDSKRQDIFFGINRGHSNNLSEIKRPSQSRSVSVNGIRYIHIPYPHPFIHINLHEALFCFTNQINVKVYPVIPPKGEYELTPLGEGLRPVVQYLQEWDMNFGSITTKEGLIVAEWKVCLHQ